MCNHVWRCPNDLNKEVNKRQKASASSTIDGNINFLLMVDLTKNFVKKI